MSGRTVNYDLILPAQDEYYNVEDFNDNAITIDEELHAVASQMTVHESSKDNPHKVTAEQLGLAGVNERLPKGATIYTIGAGTTFLGGYGAPYGEHLGAALHSCIGRTVYFGLLENEAEAQRCGLCLNNASGAQGSVTVMVKSEPTENIKLVAVDLGKFEGSQSGQLSVVIDGLALAGLKVGG